MSVLINGTDGIDFNDGSNQSTAATPYARKNLIINGDMRIAQRGTSSTGITIAGYYTVDRYNLGINSIGTWTQSQDSDVPTGQGFSNSIKLDCTTADASLAAGDYLFIQHKMEGQNLQHLKYGTANAESLTLSFWVKSNKTGTYVVELMNNDAANQHINKAYTIDSSNTWEKKTITFPSNTSGGLDNDNGPSLILTFWLASGTTFSSGTLQTSWGSLVQANRAVGQVNLADSTSNYINITGCQLEIGDSASDFEFVPYDMELARCQRYYWKNEANNTSDILSGFGEIYNTDNGQVAFHLPVAMRVPYSSYSVEWSNVSATVPSTGNYTVSSIAIASGTYTTVLLNFVSTGMTAGKNPYLRTNSTSGYIAISGEL